jgi:hypothetical protein
MAPFFPFHFFPLPNLLNSDNTLIADEDKMIANTIKAVYTAPRALAPDGVDKHFNIVARTGAAASIKIKCKFDEAATARLLDPLVASTAKLQEASTAATEVEIKASAAATEVKMKASAILATPFLVAGVASLAI